MSLLSRISRTSLRTKFVLPIAATMVLSILVISGYLIRQQADGFRRELETNGATMSRILAMQAESGVLFESKFELDELLLKFSVFEMIESAAVYDGQGQILSQLGAFKCDGARVSKEVPDAAELYGEGHVTRYIEDAGGTEFLEHSCPVITRI